MAALPEATPAIKSLCPPIYLEAVCKDISIPNVMGFWKIGVAQELSTIVTILCFLASAAISRRS